MIVDINEFFRKRAEDVEVAPLLCYYLFEVKLSENNIDIVQKGSRHVFESIVLAALTINLQNDMFVSEIMRFHHILQRKEDSKSCFLGLLSKAFLLKETFFFVIFEIGAVSIADWGY